MILSLNCPKSVSSTRCLAALKWWLEPASPPATSRCTHHHTVAIRRRAPAPSHLSMTLHATSQSDSELTYLKVSRLSQERAKYAMLGGSEAVVGISILPRPLMHASWCCDDPPPHPRSLRTPMPLQRPSKAIPSLDCPKSVPSTRCLAALKYA